MKVVVFWRFENPFFFRLIFFALPARKLFFLLLFLAFGSGGF